MYRMLKERGRGASDRYAGTPAYFHLTPASLTLLRALRPLLRSFCRGRVLDAGAGRGVYRELLREGAREYVALDVAPRAGIDVAGDVQRLPFADGSFDTVFCSQVLEHVPEPRLALAEFGRILKPGGRIILTVPHLSWLHNEPHDYYRFTGHGVRFLLEQSGFSPETIRPAGGLLSLLGHIPSTVLMNTTFGIPLLHPLARSLNRGWVALAAFADERLEKKKLFALNVVAVARKGEK